MRCFMNAQIVRNAAANGSDVTESLGSYVRRKSRAHRICEIDQWVQGSSTFNCNLIPAQIRRFDPTTSISFRLSQLIELWLGRNGYLLERKNNQTVLPQRQQILPRLYHSYRLRMRRSLVSRMYGLLLIHHIFCFAQPLLTNYVSLTSSVILGEQLKIFMQLYIDS